MALLGNLTGSAQYFNDKVFYNGVATQSLRFDDGSSAYLHRTPSSAGNRRTFTWSSWVKRGNLGSEQTLLMAGADVNNQFRLISEFSDAQFQVYYYVSGNKYVTPSAVFRDVSAWYHVVFAIDTTQSTASNRIKIYINGEQITDLETENQPTQNFETQINNNTLHTIGRRSYASDSYFDGYLSEVNLVDGLALDPTYFGETKNGVWIAKEYSGSYGTNGFRLQFNQTGTGTASASTIGADTSGNTHHFTSSGIAASDCAMPDSPENNFATINSIREDTLVNGSVTLSEGNLQSVDASTTYGRHWSSTIGMSTGKWYWEVLAHTLGGNYANIGLGNDVEKGTTSVANGAIGVYYGNDGKRNARAQEGGSTTYGATYADDDIIGIAFDADNESVTFYKNNSSQGAVGSVLVQSTGPYFASVGDGQNSTTYKYVANFGQDSSFAGNKTAQGNTDGNGIGDFYYAPPSGFLALCTSNLPEPTISPNSATQADDHFNTVLYTGSGSTQTINTGFSTDFTWIKNRGTTNSHLLADSSRGSTKVLLSSGTNAEITDSNYTTFVSNGFSVSGNGNEINNSSGTYVSWNWKANGGTTSSNSDGSITSTVQANTDAGFSIVTYTGTGSAITVGHGLGNKPEMIIAKRRDSTSGFPIYHQDLTSASYYVQLNSTSAQGTGNNVWNQTDPTSTVFTVGTDMSVSSGTYVAYVFSEIESYSRFGSYTGNSSSTGDGTFVYLGFKPSFVMLKDIGGGEWGMFDSARNTFNVVNKLLQANVSDAEYSGDSNRDLDFLSNGFKLRNGSALVFNNSSRSYIYMAFAETPFKYANAR